MTRDDITDGMYMQSVAEELREAGCDETFIECTLDDLREGGDVTVYVFGRKMTFVAVDADTAGGK